MSAYVIATIVIHDREEYKNYARGALAIFATYGAEVLIAEDAPQVLEGEWDYTRTVVIRFEDEAAAKRWYESPEYQAAAKFRFNSATTNLIFAKGLK